VWPVFLRLTRTFRACGVDGDQCIAELQTFCGSPASHANFDRHGNAGKPVEDDPLGGGDRSMLTGPQLVGQREPAVEARSLAVYDQLIA
jgi:hypothetical protein